MTTFKIRAENRAYDCRRPRGCTALCIEVAEWPGNEFGLWLPELVVLRGKRLWTNHQATDVFQDWERVADGRLEWKKPFEAFELTSDLIPDEARSCIRYRHTFTNRSEEALSDLNASACFHLANAPQFISIRGERIWACLDGEWTTTDRVPRSESPDPRRVRFLNKGIRSERTVVPEGGGFPMAVMPEAAHHPLIVAESFSGAASVGIATPDLHSLFNNNEPILRCLHSISFPVRTLEPGRTASLEGVLVFCNGNHLDAVRQYEEIAAAYWPTIAARGLRKVS
ncbi:MAG: hypothetical protein JXR37_26290 [Kiritimatiellae bacterium]|nr:hypothetical protein [Kiritimatiellia bacterium]